MLFSKDSWAGLADGSITRTFRTWSRAQAKVGGRYRVGGMLLEVDAIGQVPISGLTDADAVAAGAPDLSALLKRLRVADGGADGGQVWRIDLHYVGPDDRIALRSEAEIGGDEVARIVTRLNRLDAASPVGPWTRAVLRLIEQRPEVVSTELAEHLGRERQDFKTDVRKLKNLGLTQSFAIGYRLSPRGAVVLAALDAESPN